MHIGKTAEIVLENLKYHSKNITLCESLRQDFPNRDKPGKQAVRSQVNYILNSLKSKGLVVLDEGHWRLTEKGEKYRSFIKGIKEGDDE